MVTEYYGQDVRFRNEDKQIRLVPVEGPEKNDKKGDSLKEQIDYESDEASEEEQQQHLIDIQNINKIS